MCSNTIAVLCCLRLTLRDVPVGAFACRQLTRSSPRNLTSTQAPFVAEVHVQDSIGLVILLVYSPFGN